MAGDAGRTWRTVGGAPVTLVAMAAFAPVLWKKIPATDPAARILALVRESQPNRSDLPEGSTYNYIWAQNMMAWMVAERSGLMTAEEANRRLVGLLTRVANWETHHGFYFDAYDPKTGKRTSDNVYFQGWWLWALILAREAYPQAAPLADRILKRLDYDQAGMIDATHTRMAADRNAKTGKVTFYIDPTGDISGELRTPLITYTWLTGDTTPWQTNAHHRFIDVGGESILAVWHHFTFDPFFVHSTFPETGYFARSFEALKKGAEVHRKANGMTFYATRMDPLEAWKENPAEWPNTEHRVAKPWTAWLTNPNAPVMERAWVPGYGVVQLFDNWNFRWGFGTSSSIHPQAVSSGKPLSATFRLEVLPKATQPPLLKRLLLRTIASSGTGPLIVRVNGQLVGEIAPGSKGGDLIPPMPIVLGESNRVTLETTGAGSWRFHQTERTFRPMDDGSAAIDLEVTVEGQRADRENPFAFLCRAAGAYGNHPWKLLLEKNPHRFGDRLVAWVGPYAATVENAHRIYNVDTEPVKVTYRLSATERGYPWSVDNATNLARTGDTLTWSQPGHTMARLQTK